MGGDEFTVVLSPIRSAEDAANVSRELLAILATPFVIDGQKLTISASIGISLFPYSALEPVELMQEADCAMYAAKRGGKNRFEFYHEELGNSMRERTNLEAQLRTALDRGEIEVHYQPEFDAKTQKLIRFEALARWTHPTLGPISSAKFIPVAEESGLIVVRPRSHPALRREPGNRV